MAVFAEAHLVAAVETRVVETGEGVLLKTTGQRHRPRILLVVCRPPVAPGVVVRRGGLAFLLEVVRSRLPRLLTLVHPRL